MKNLKPRKNRQYSGKKKREKEKWSTKHYAKNSRLNNTNPIGGKLKWPGAVGSIWITGRIYHVEYLMISH